MEKRRRYYIGLGLWCIIYLIGLMTAPLTPSRFNLSTKTTHLLLLTIAIPLIIIWTIAIFGTERLQSYSKKISSHPDGKAFGLIATGLLVLAINIMFSGLSQIVRPWAFQGHWIGGWSIFINTLQAVLPVIAFGCMLVGAKRLVAMTKKPASALKLFVIPLVATGVLSAFYLHTVYTYQYRNHTPDPSTYSSFYLSDIGILFSVCIPYIISWLLGMMSIAYLVEYRRRVQGHIYKLALNNVAAGIALSVICAVLIQTLIAFSTYLAKAKLQSVIVVIYALLLLYAIGFLYLAFGSKKLNAIEEAGSGK